MLSLLVCNEGNLSSDEHLPFLRGLSLSVDRRRGGQRGGRARGSPSTLATRSLALKRRFPSNSHSLAAAAERAPTPTPTLQCPHCHAFMNLVNVDEYMRTYSPRPLLKPARATRPPLKPRILIPSPSPPPSPSPSAAAAAIRSSSNADDTEEQTLADAASTPDERTSVQVQSPESESPSNHMSTPPPSSTANRADAPQVSGSTSTPLESSIFAASGALPLRAEPQRVSRASKMKCLQLLNSIAHEERHNESSSDESDDDSALLHQHRAPRGSSLLAASFSSSSSSSSQVATRRTASSRAAPASLVGRGARGGSASASASCSSLLYIAMPRAEERLTVAARFVSAPAAAPRRHASVRPDLISSAGESSLTLTASETRAETVGAIDDAHRSTEEAATNDSAAANSSATLQWLQSPSCLPLEPLDMD